MVIELEHPIFGFERANIEHRTLLVLSHNYSMFFNTYRTFSLFSCSRNQETISNDRRQIINVDHHPACAKTTVPFLQIYKMIQKTSCACIRIRYTISHWMIDHTASEEEKKLVAAFQRTCKGRLPLSFQRPPNGILYPLRPHPRNVWEYQRWFGFY